MRETRLSRDLLVFLGAAAYIAWRSPAIAAYLESADLGYQLSS